MRKIGLFAISAISALFLSSVPALACTSFAVYSDNTLYGMNFDYPKTELKFSFHNNKGLKEFYMGFLEGGSYYTTSGVNSKGLFIALQNQYPALPAKENLEDNEIYIGQLIDGIDRYSTVDEVRTFLKDRRVAPMRVPVHVLAADTDGDSMIIEAGEKQNDIIISDRKFMVMTNFKNSDFAGQSYDKVTGTGADRYKTAYKMIQDNFLTFDADFAWNVLESTIQDSGGYPTQCSTVYDPAGKAIYLALDRNFDRIWKISLDEGTISTHKGFDINYTIRMNEGEITASELTGFKPSTDGTVVSGIGVLSHPPVEAKGKGTTLVITLVLVTIVLIGLSVVPALMFSRAMRHKKGGKPGATDGDIKK